MPLKIHQPAIVHLVGNNSVLVQTELELPLAETKVVSIIAVIAECLDMIAGGEDIYLVIGATPKRDAFTLTVKHNGSPTTLYASSLSALADQAAGLLS